MRGLSRAIFLYRPVGRMFATPFVQTNGVAPQNCLAVVSLDKCHVEIKTIFSKVHSRIEKI